LLLVSSSSATLFSLLQLPLDLLFCGITTIPPTCDWDTFWNTSPIIGLGVPGANDDVVLGVAINFNLASTVNVNTLNLGSSSLINVSQAATLNVNQNVSVGTSATLLVFGSVQAAVLQVLGNLTLYAGGAVNAGLQTAANTAVTVGQNAAAAQATLTIDANSLVQGTLNLLESSYLHVTNAATLVVNTALTVSGDVTIDEDASLTLQGGGSSSYNLLAGSNLTLNGVLTASSVQNQGFVSGNGNITGSVTNSGTFSPGQSPGTLFVNGDYTQTSSGTYKFELASSSSYDKIVISGHLSRAGILEANLLNGYVPAAGSQFVLLTHASSSGSYTITRGNLDQSFFKFTPQYKDTTTSVFYANSGTKASIAVFAVLGCLFALLI